MFHQVRRKKIGIIGAGVSGLATAKAFSAQGHHVIGFERSETIGGVWDPKRTYPGVKTQSSKELYRFTDLPMPEKYPEWPSGDQVLSYLESYAEKHDLLKLFRFGAIVKSIDKRNDEKKGWVLSIDQHQHDHNNKSEKYKMTFDFVVVCTGTFTNPNILVHPGQNDFSQAGGIVKHSSEYKDISSDVAGKCVLVIGGSKSATDIAVHAANKGGARQVILLHRRVVWRIPYFVAGINFKHLLYSRVQEIQFTDSWNFCPTRTSQASSFLSRMTSSVKKALCWGNFRLLETILDFQLGLKKMGMLPQQRIEDTVSCGLPVVTEGLFESFENGSIRPINSIVKCYQVIDVNDGKRNCKKMYAILDNREKIETETVIQATGWTMNLPFLQSDIKEKLIDDDDGLYRLYRFAINPDLPDIGFVGFNSSFCSVLSSEMIAHWLVRYADGMLVEKKTSREMNDEIERLLEWKRKVRPAAMVYGGNCIAPFHHLHFDEILNDVGATETYDSMFGYPDADKIGQCLESAPKYLVDKG